MAIQYVDAVADAAGSITGPYNITASNDQFSVNVDGSGTQTFSLTQGSARTAAQVVTDLAGLTGATATAVSIGGGTTGGQVVRLRTTSAAGNSSTIQFLAPANHSNTILGFATTTYKGGAPTWSIFDAQTKQKIINGIESALLIAGWVTISGSGTTNLLMQSALSPNSQNLRIRMRIKDLGNTSVSLHLENVGATITSAANGAAWLFPQTGKGFKIISNKYQAFIFVDGEGHLGARNFCAFGVPYLPDNLRGFTYECAWLMTNAQSDGDTSPRSSFRHSCWGNALDAPALGGPFRVGLWNGNYWEDLNNNLDDGGNQLFGPLSTYSASNYRWMNGAAPIVEPIIAWGVISDAFDPVAMGQLWEGYVAFATYWNDTIVTGIDSRSWQCITTFQRPSLFLKVS